MFHLLSPILMAIVLFTTNVAASEMIAGPVSARVLKVQDGDTLIVLVKIWPGHEVKAHVRIRGIDAPEIKARCPQEQTMAKAARDLLAKLVSGGRIHLRKIVRGKYYGRVLADVNEFANQKGAGLQETLLQSGLVRPYRGRKRKSWCAEG